MGNEEHTDHVAPTPSDSQGDITPGLVEGGDYEENSAFSSTANEASWGAGPPEDHDQHTQRGANFSTSQISAAETTGSSVPEGDTPRPLHMSEPTNVTNPTEAPLDEVPFDLLDPPDASSRPAGYESRDGRGENFEAWDLDPELIHMVAVNQRILQGYLCERFSPELQPNILRLQSAVELRRACVETVGQVENTFYNPMFYSWGERRKSNFFEVIFWLDKMCPSLDPRDRIVFLSAKQSAARVTYLLQSFVSSRLQKILESPSIFWRMQQEKEWRNRRRGLETSRVETIVIPPTETPGILNSVEAVAFDVLERAFAQEVEKLWDAYGIVESYAPSLFRTVHCRAMPDGPSVAAARFSADEMEETGAQLGLSLGSTTRKRLLEALGDASKDCAEAMAMTPSAMGSILRTSADPTSQTSQVQAASVASFPHTQDAARSRLERSMQGTGVSGSFDDSLSQERGLAPGAVLTADYNLVKYLVQEGSLSLIG